MVESMVRTDNAEIPVQHEQWFAHGLYNRLGESSRVVQLLSSALAGVYVVVDDDSAVDLVVHGAVWTDVHHVPVTCAVAYFPLRHLQRVDHVSDEFFDVPDVYVGFHVADGAPDVGRNDVH